MKVGVVGAGTMGAGIAQVCLLGGHEVRLYDVSPEATDAGRRRLEARLGQMVAKGRLDAAAHESASAHLTTVADLGDVAEGADMVIEAAVEDLAAKQAIFGTLDRAAPPEALLATNTSALSVTAIAQATTRPGRVIGLHFFNPAPLMPLVEVVAGARTEGPTIDAAMEFIRALGKDPIPCRDAPGFIVNRVNRPFTLEALRMLEAGEADIQAVDAAMVAGGYPMGPFALVDLVGVDVNLAVARTLYEGFEEAERFRPSPVQERLVAAGTLGRKSGRGFYRYDEVGGLIGPAEGFEPPEPAAWADAISARGTPLATLDADTIRARIELSIINEAYRAAGDDVASPPDIDLALVLGAGHPVGPFARARALGLGRVVASLRDLERQHGERFRVAQALWQVASI
ncbi:MAG TPA: 3-hydroxyacyl-CoA dehydrogenase NAD-binding domain-containing protein [Candidatus Saccharimonadia bacterium]|nr:3-hydroxyacyl-CoA dehydrogenase NAD-binding domain-containing protein [Candidatus Saccharimonadia bacterium]